MKRRFFVVSMVMLSACALTSQRQAIDLEVTHWVVYAFSEGFATATIKVPPGFRSFNSKLPEVAYNERSQRLLLDVNYDDGRSISTLHQFEIVANFIKLRRPVNINATPGELDGALQLVFGRPINADASPKPIFETIGKRAWIHYDNSAIETVGMTRETHGTLVNETTALLVTGWYLDSIRKDPAWFQSRRDLLRTVRDQIVITP